MATTSEIQVTEAYIGLLGRAPDPAGLAYWAAELDAAIADGTDPAVALKELTNNITLSEEWDGGIGAYDATTLGGAESVVTDMYDNLFDRVATQAELDYWAPKIVSGEFTASEMAVAIRVSVPALYLTQVPVAAAPNRSEAPETVTTEMVPTHQAVAMTRSTFAQTK